MESLLENTTVLQLAELAAEQALEARIRERDRRAKRTRLGWYLTCPVVGQSDKRAVEALTLRKFDTYYPLVREKHVIPKREMTRRQRNSGVEIIEVRDRPFLPRYVFVEMDPAAGDWEITTEYCGIRGLVCRDRQPVRFDAALIENMRAREIGEGVIAGATPAVTVFDIGENVMVIDGPFASFPGIVEKLRTKAIADIDIITSLRVLVDIFGRPTPVELNCDQVAKLETGDHG